MRGIDRRIKTSISVLARREEERPLQQWNSVTSLFAISYIIVRGDQYGMSEAMALMGENPLDVCYPSRLVLALWEIGVVLLKASERTPPYLIISYLRFTAMILIFNKSFLSTRDTRSLLNVDCLSVLPYPSLYPICVHRDCTNPDIRRATHECEHETGSFLA